MAITTPVNTSYGAGSPLAAKIEQLAGANAGKGILGGVLSHIPSGAPAGAGAGSGAMPGYGGFTPGGYAGWGTPAGPQVPQFRGGGQDSR